MTVYAIKGEICKAEEEWWAANNMVMRHLQAGESLREILDRERQGGMRPDGYDEPQQGDYGIAKCLQTLTDHVRERNPLDKSKTGHGEAEKCIPVQWCTQHILAMLPDCGLEMDQGR